MKNDNFFPKHYSSINLKTTTIAVEIPIFMNNIGFYYLSWSISQNL